MDSGIDSAIIEKLRRHSGDGLRLLRERYGGLIGYVVRGVLRDSRDVEECVSDIYMKIYENIASYNPNRAPFSAWLTAVARNAAVDILRKSGAEEEEFSDSAASSPSPEDELLRRERKKALAAALSELYAAERQLIYRKYYYLQSTAQIAAEMGLTERAVEGRLYRIRAKLKQMLGGDFGE